MITPLSSDVLIIGGGIAGLSLALRVADQARVTILTKEALTEGASLYAQGGVAAVLNGREDTFDSHIQDTLDAGAGLCHRDTVKFAVGQGPAAIRWLIQRGVPFSREKQPNGGLEYHLTREGGHSHRRVIHQDRLAASHCQSMLDGFFSIFIPQTESNHVSALLLC